MIVDRPLLSEHHAAHLLGFPREVLRGTAERAHTYYRPFRLGARRRLIDNPLEPLKSIQHAVKRLLATRVLPPWICGATVGGSTQQNAAAHTRQSVVVTLDVAQFFPSIACGAVAQVFHQHFGASNDVRWLLTRLTTRKDYLPQGSPSSSALANLVILPTMERVKNLCDANGWNCTIYVDDITISGRGAEHSVEEIAAILRADGFRLARPKVRVMRRGARQVVTGHVVNEKLSNGRDRLRAARQLVLQALAEPHNLQLVRRVRGLVHYLYATAPNQAKWLMAQVDRLPKERLPSS